MKLFLSIFLVSLSLSVSAAAEAGAPVEIKNDASIVELVSYDRGKKNNRRHKRLNKKRKRKCQQFGRQVYAG
ncbi:MAG: hypothetical protein A3D92_12305 [Bacteroidetes bacterium RIFCSPHIGHO2_02_FULL_44_7]|nr:MAG: hypothetical protein A3D92_12305 [Bacteroidetes bacterium RIFCSPHIGHO2_02_FULL_44_7]